MPRLPRGKVGVYVYLDEKLYKELRRLIKMKYEQFHGAFSHEINEAIRNWLLLHTQNAHKAMSASLNPQPKVGMIFEEIKEYLRNRYDIMFFPGQQLPKKLIVEAIRAVRGTDERTVRKWLKLFMEYKLIKPVSPHVFEIV